MMFDERPLFDYDGMRIGTQMGNGLYDNGGMWVGDVYGSVLRPYDAYGQTRIGGELNLYDNHLDALSGYRSWLDRSKDLF